MKRFFLFFLLSILMLSAFSQERDLDAFRYRFMTDKAFPSQDLNEYYINLFEFSMNYPVSKKKYGFLLPDGKRFVEGEFDFASNFIGDKANIVNNNISGLLFKNGKVKYFPQFKLTYFSSGNLGLAVSNDKFGFINLEGEEIIPFIYDDAFPFYQGFASVKTGDKWQYINTRGEKILSSDKITSYQPLNDSKVVIYDSTKTIQHKLGFLLPTLTEFMNKVAKPNYKQQLFDLKSKAFIEKDDFDEIAESNETGLIKVVKAGKVGLINTNGKIVIPTDYDEIGNLKGKLICAKKGKWGIIDYQNKVIIPFDYEAMNLFSEKMALVSKNGKAGYINKKK